VGTEENLEERLRNFVRSRPSLHQAILLYQPIWLNQFIKDVKEVSQNIFLMPCSKGVDLLKIYKVGYLLN
jgi:hypothetical protein